MMVSDQSAVVDKSYLLHTCCKIHMNLGQRCEYVN